HEKIAYAAGAHTDEHLHELRSADAEERRARLASDRTPEECFSGAWRAHQQDAARNARANLEIFRGVSEKVDDFCQIVLGLVFSSDVGKGHLRTILCIPPRP